MLSHRQKRGLTLGLTLSALLLPLQGAHAGLFDDDEARRRIIALEQKQEQQTEQLRRSLLELSAQIQSLRDEIAQLRGQNETVNYRLDTLEKRLQDLYVDLDARLRRFEPQTNTNSTSDNPGGTSTAAGGDELKTYEAALALYQAKKYKPAAAALDQFLRSNPNSAYAPKAMFWLGNSWYAQGECKPAIDAHSRLLKQWPDSDKAPEALLAIAGCQQRDNQIAAARQSLENLMAKYPNAAAATIAQQRLSTLGKR